MDIVSPNDSSCNEDSAKPVVYTQELVRAILAKHKAKQPPQPETPTPEPVQIELVMPQPQTYSTDCLVNDEYEQVRKSVDRARKLYVTFGISLDEYDAMLARQDGVCAACGGYETDVVNGRIRQLSVDHDHETGKVRGLLCGNCNRALGLAKDNPVLLRALAAYLERHKR